MRALAITSLPNVLKCIYCFSRFVFMWMLLSITCVAPEVAQAHTLPVGAISMLGTEIFQLCHILAGISMMASAKVEVEKLRVIMISIR